MHWELIDTSARPVRTHGHSLIILLSGLKMASSEQQGDFLDIVQGYLDRGEIFKPVEEFVTKLTLCKRCIGGARQKDVLKDTLSRMASLVKDKLATQRNKKNLQGWLKTVAKDLDTFQIVSRDWISEHIWKLPELPKPRQEEEYDPMKGRRDIRYYPSTAANEAALLELTAHEEMETELDYVDEDKLLASSPCKSTVTVESPRRSPRIQQRLQSTPTTRAAIVSPRRSPRSSKVQPLQDPSRKVSSTHSHIPSATLAVTCSPARKSRRDESTGPARGGHLKRKPSADGRQALRDTRVKSARSEDSSARRQQKGIRACSSLSSAAFTSVDCVVTDTYPTERFLDRMPEHIGVGIGFHPRHARNSRSSIDEGVRQLRRLLRHPRVIAGEVGLDHTEPLKYWAYQVELLEKVLPYLEDRHVLLIHCRGMIGDCGTEAFLLLLHFLKKNVRQHQQIHLHCFTGNSYVLGRWLEVFPRAYFGFTNKVGRFSRHQREALCKIDENRLLLESDAPYFPIEGETVSSPSQLYVLAETMAAHRQLTVERMLEVTVANALHLYHGQQ